MHICDTSDARHISFLLNRFSVKYRFPFPILRFLPQNHIALLKDRFLKKMRLKRTKTRRFFFFVKTIGSNTSLTLIEHNFSFFEITKFEFKVTVHCSLLAKCTKLWPLKLPFKFCLVFVLSSCFYREHWCSRL